jgi:hypothetical protein
MRSNISKWIELVGERCAQELSPRRAERIPVAGTPAVLRVDSRGRSTGWVPLPALEPFETHIIELPAMRKRVLRTNSSFPARRCGAASSEAPSIERE